MSTMINYKNRFTICCAIVTYNGSKNVERQVIELQDSCAIVIIDNGSNSEYITFLKSLKNKYNVQLILNEVNAGLATALNQGLQYADENGYPYFLTLDQDSFFVKENIDIMISAFSKNDSIVSVGPNLKSKKSCFVNYLITSGNIVKTDVLKKLGGYDSKLFIDNIDIEISFRFLANNMKMYAVGGTIFKHKIGEIERSPILRIKYLSHSPDRFYWMYRNERYLLKKYNKKLKKLCFKSYLASCFGVLKVIILEKNKLKKIKQIHRGWKDGKTVAND